MVASGILFEWNEAWSLFNHMVRIWEQLINDLMLIGCCFVIASRRSAFHHEFFIRIRREIESVVSVGVYSLKLNPLTLSWVEWRDVKSDLVAESCEKLFRILLNLSMNIPAKHLIVSSQLMNVERAEHFYDAWSAVKCCEILRGGKKSAFVCIHSSMIMEGIFCSSFFIFALISIHDGSWI